MLREDRVDGRQDADAGDEAGQDDVRARTRRPVRSSQHCAGDAREDRRNRNRLLGCRSLERLVRRNLPDCQDRDAVHRVEPRAHARAEHEPGRETLGAGAAREQREQDARSTPDGEIEDERDAAPVRQLVERQRVAQAWAG